MINKRHGMEAVAPKKRGEEMMSAQLSEEVEMQKRHASRPEKVEQDKAGSPAW